MFISPQRKDHINRQKVNQRSLKTATPKQEVISVFLKIPLFASFLFYFFVFSHPQLFNKPFLDYFRCMHQLPVCSSTFGLFISWHLTFHCDSKRNGMILNIILSFKKPPSTLQWERWCDFHLYWRSYFLNLLISYKCSPSSH